MGSSVISLGLGLGGGKSATSSGRAAGGGLTPISNGFSISLDGTDDYMDIPDSTALETTAFTWSAWFYCTAIDRYNIIVDTATNSSFFLGYEIFVVNSTCLLYTSPSPRDH